MAKIENLVPPAAVVRVGIEAAGHYHQPLMMSSSWPSGWELRELNPAHVTEQRRVQGRRRVKTDAIDLEAITELMLAGAGHVVTDRDLVLGEIAARVAHRTRRIEVRTATKNQLLGQLDRAFPGLTLALPDVLGTKVGRLVATEFADPARLVALGEARFIRFAAHRGLQVRRPLAERVVAAAREALPTRDAAAAREILADDLQLLAVLDRQVAEAEACLDGLLPQTPFAVLTTVPGWATVRASAYGAALGDPARWPGPRQVYRAAGLSPMQYESAGKRRDGTISREGSVVLQQALIDLGIGLWFNEIPHRPLQQVGSRGDRGRYGLFEACCRARRVPQRFGPDGDRLHLTESTAPGSGPTEDPRPEGHERRTSNRDGQPAREQQCH